MKKKEIFNLFVSLQSLGELSGAKFSYTVAKNLNIIRPEIEALQKSLEASKEFQEYDQKRVEIVKKYAKKDEKGNPIINNNVYEIENQKGLDKEMKPLLEEYKTVIEKREKQVEEYNKMIEGESDVKLFKIKLEELPEKMTVAQTTQIYSIIEEK